MLGRGPEFSSAQHQLRPSLQKMSFPGGPVEQKAFGSLMLFAEMFSEDLLSLACCPLSIPSYLNSTLKVRIIFSVILSLLSLKWE